MREFRAVLFDFGGVLAEEGFSNGLQELAREQNLDVENITAEGMRAVYDSGFVLGRGSEAEFWSLLRERTGLQGNDDELASRMINGFVIRTWMIELVDALRQQGYITGILSDQVDWLDRLDQQYHFYRHFDHVYNSYYMGKGKRDPTHFSDVASALDLDAEYIIFVDDSESNVARAESAGMRGIRYVDRESFTRELGQLLYRPFA